LSNNYLTLSDVKTTANHRETTQILLIYLSHRCSQLRYNFQHSDVKTTEPQILLICHTGVLTCVTTFSAQTQTDVFYKKELFVVSELTCF